MGEGMGMLKRAKQVVVSGAVAQWGIGVQVYREDLPVALDPRQTKT